MENPSNPCFNSQFSCSACCGIYNVDLPEARLIEWLEKNTAEFLGLDLNDRSSVLEFRRRGEDFLQPLARREDVYICPFIGAVSENPYRTGCLLNPTGSPHPQALAMDSPQSFSFYGTSVCQGYDCRAKISMGGDLNEILQASSGASPLSYGRLVSNHNLMEVLRKILSESRHSSREETLRKVIGRLDNQEVPVTSFEMPLDLGFYSISEYWEILGMMFHPEGYIFEAFAISDEGRNTGKALKIQIEKL